MLIKNSIILLFLIGIVTATCPKNCNDCDPSGMTCFACAQDY